MQQIETYTTITQFNQNGEEITINVGDITPEGPMVAAIYKDLKTEQTNIVVITPQPLARAVTWQDGQKAIGGLNKSKKFAKFGEFAYANGGQEMAQNIEKSPNTLLMMHENRNLIGEPLLADIHGGAYSNFYVTLLNDKGIKCVNKYDGHKADVLAVAIVNAADVEGKGISFQPRNAKYAMA